MIAYISNITCLIFDFRTLRRLIFALSALTRGNPKCVETIQVLGGFKILHKITEKHLENKEIALKSLTFISDLVSNSATNEVLKFDSDFCRLLKSENLYSDWDKGQDLDFMERLVKILDTLQPICDQDGRKIVTEGTVQKWLKSARYKLWKENQEDGDFKVTIESLNRLLSTLKDEL